MQEVRERDEGDTQTPLTIVRAALNERRRMAKQARREVRCPTHASGCGWAVAYWVLGSMYQDNPLFVILGGIGAVTYILHSVVHLIGQIVR